MSLLGRGPLQGSDDITTWSFHSFFVKKVSDIRASTSGDATPSFAYTDYAYSELSFGVVSGIVGGMRVLDGGPSAPSEGVVSWGFSHTGFSGIFV